MAFDGEQESFTGPVESRGNNNWNEIATTCQAPAPQVEQSQTMPREFGAGTLQIVDGQSLGSTGGRGPSDRQTPLENRPERSEQPGRGGPFDRVLGFINQLIDRFVPQQYRDMARGIVDQVSNMVRDGRVNITARDGGHDVSLDLTNTPIAQALGRLPGNISAGRLSFHVNRGRVSNIQGLQVGGHSVTGADFNTGQVTTSNGSFVIPTFRR